MDKIKELKKMATAINKFPVNVHTDERLLILEIRASIQQLQLYYYAKREVKLAHVSPELTRKTEK